MSVLVSAATLLIQLVGGARNGAEAGRRVQAWRDRRRGGMTTATSQPRPPAPPSMPAPYVVPDGLPFGVHLLLTERAAIIDRITMEYLVEEPDLAEISYQHRLLAENAGQCVRARDEADFIVRTAQTRLDEVQARIRAMDADRPVVQNLLWDHTRAELVDEWREVDDGRDVAQAEYTALDEALEGR